ncbi:hypothetical protein EQV77_14885 [Halobacillus fulvus]|nr:hypothetical protein EQV77_14885 [Halobacillus fulvus]
MKKIAFILSGVIVVGLALFFIVNTPEKTTFDELLQTKLDPSDAINEISISSQSEDKVATITNRQDIENFIQKASDMDLESTDDPPNIQYVLRVKTYQEADVAIAVGKERIDLWQSKSTNHSSDETSGIYQIKGENSLLEVLETTDFGWQEP